MPALGVERREVVGLLSRLHDPKQIMLGTCMEREGAGTTACPGACAARTRRTRQAICWIKGHMDRGAPT